MLFRRLFLCALFVGAVSGLIHSAVQRWQVQPLIEAAEVFESAGHQGHDHSHQAVEWTPEEGAERITWTLIANVLGATGFALLLLPAMALWDRQHAGDAASWRTGLLWGAAAWLCVFALPAIGLPPELPGTLAAGLRSRQAWWLLTVACGVSAMALVVLARGRLGAWRWLGVSLLVLPFAIGAPHVQGDRFASLGADAAAQMETLSARFVYATSFATAAYWLVLGALSGMVVARWVRPLLMNHAAAARNSAGTAMRSAKVSQ